jgi:hypothetical protein
MKATNFDQIWSSIFLHCAVKTCSVVLKKGFVSKRHFLPEPKSLKQNTKAKIYSEQSKQAYVSLLGVINETISL